MSNEIDKIDTSRHWRPDLPYNDLPFLPPKQELETKTVLKQCIAARASVAELKQAAELIPNQGVLINTLPLLEAQASSEIENIVTTSDRLFRFRQIDERSADPATKEALRYCRALMAGYRALADRPLTTRSAELICTEIKGIEMSIRRVPGTALGSQKTGKVVYTPPDGEDLIPTLLANWERFLHNSTEIDPLVRMAVAHYQFEAIHPFTDGNGRTGRVLNSLFLIQEELLTLPILYLSRYIIAHKSDYHRKLLAVTRDEAWEQWVLFILKGLEETARWTVGKIAAIRKLHSQTVEHARTHAPKIYSRELIDIIFEQPYCRISNLTESGIAARQTASVYLKKLENLGILKLEKVGRENLFVHPQLLQLLTHDSNQVTPYG